MTQSDSFVANAAGSVVRADLNTIIESILTMNEGASAPSPTFPNMFWADSANDLLYKRDSANTTWVEVGPLDDILGDFGDFATAAEVLAGTEAAKVIAPDALYALWKKGTDIASGGVLSLPATGGRFFVVTGSTAVTGISTAPAGREVLLRFSGALVLTHNGTSFILPGSQNYTTVAGDTWHFTSLGSGNWVCVGVSRAVGGALISLNASTLIGRTSGSGGTPQEITLGTGLGMSGTTLNVTSTPIFTAAFTSTAQSITQAGLRTLAHGLGGVPTLIQIQLHCVTAQYNYSPGDIVILSPNYNGNGGGTQTMAVYIDGTNVYVRYPNSTNGIVIADKTTGSAGAITYANWNIVVKAWR